MTLTDTRRAELDAMKTPELQALCREMSLPSSRRKAELIERLLEAMAEQDGEVRLAEDPPQHVNGRTVCPYCGATARVTCTKRVSGRITRYLRCADAKRPHRFKLAAEDPSP